MKKEREKVKLNKGALWLGLRSQHVADALRNTVTIVIPFAVFFALGHPAAAIAMGTGTLLISPTDLPGNRSDKFTSAWVALVVFMLTSIIMSFALSYFLLLALCICSLTFAFSIMGVFGPRMASIGVMGTILATFTIGLRPADPWHYAFYITLGGIWYFLVSTIQVWIFPYYPLQRSILKCKKYTAELMRLRARGYDATASLSGFNTENIRLHVKLTNEHELIRRLLLGDRWAEKNRDTKSRQLLHQSLVLIDLYEKVSAIHYDYTQLRELLRDGGALPKINGAINRLATIVAGKSTDFLSVNRYVSELESLVGVNDQGQLLSKLIANLKEAVSLIESLDRPALQGEELLLGTFRSFLPTSSFSVQTLKSHLHLKSPVFRFALRISLLVLTAIVLIHLLPKEGYGYWLPLTLIIVSRPSYGMTRKRNWERFFGTLIGLALSWILIKASLPQSAQLGIAVVFLFVFFSFFFVRYWVSALSITVAVVLCLSLYHGNVEQLFLQRLAFTSLGCVFGIMATFLFPIWHSTKLGTLVDQSIAANLSYLLAVKEMAMSNLNQMRLARKQAYLVLSTLNEAVNLSGSEPFWKRKNLSGIKQVELLCFQLNALIGAYSLAKVQGNDDYVEAELNEIIANLRVCSRMSLDNDVAMIDKPLVQLHLRTVSLRLKEFYVANAEGMYRSVVV